jgi:hypothetical protein
MAIPAAAPAPAKPAAPAQPNGAALPPAEFFLETKVDGEMRKFTKEEALRALSKVGFADKTVSKMREEAKLIAEERERLKAQEALWEDDERLEAELEKRGKLDKLALKRLQAKAAEQELTPEQRQAATEKARADKLQKELDERLAIERKTKQTETVKLVQQRMESQLAQAAEKAGLGKDADSFFAVYETVREWHRLGLPWDAERIIETAKENIDSGFKRLEQSVTKSLKGKALVERLGKSVVDEILRYKTEELRGGGAPRPPPAPYQRQSEQKTDTLSVSDLANRYRSGQVR